ncbi:MAG TPA: hypothetical protein VGZ93_04835 [Candidatus Methylacidiphilales bacterium]|nr:hypothetical protein [Candidatus Methylacidiphilales bacterium]
MISHLVLNEASAVPAGQPKIARQFIAGYVSESTGVPEGRLNYDPPYVFKRPSGTPLSTIRIPGNKLPGYYQTSLRDETISYL